MMRSYLRLLTFALGMLLGLQVPGFMDDYSKRIEASRLESQQALLGFRKTAERFYQGDLRRLHEHYQRSADPVMRSDAASIEGLIERSELLENEWQVMQRAWPVRLWHMLTRADHQLLSDTWRSYHYQALLTPEAITWGLACGFLLAWLIELLGLSLGIVTGHRRRRQLSFRE